MDIVVGAALSGIVEALQGKLGELLLQQYELLSGVRDDVVFLRSELSAMRAAIRYCDSLVHPDAQTAVWISRVRELAYDIEDWVDLFGIRVDSGGAAGSPAGATSNVFGWLRRGAKKLATVPDRHVFANELKDLKERVIELSGLRSRYSCALPHAAAPRPVDPRLATLYVDPGSLVGLDGPVEEVSRIVLDAGGNAGFKVVCIVGMAGAGKTTLAHAVYKRLEEQKSFQCYAFISVGQKPESINKVLADMLWKLGGSHRGIEDISQLIVQLRALLANKRYLIVVDDLWGSREHWSIISCCCQDNSLGSRIIITTRNAALATECSSGSDKSIYKIGFLSNADSENLFTKKAFGNGNDCPQHLKDVFAQTLSKCGGLPLAIVTRAAMLAHKQSRDDWERLGLSSLASLHTDGVKQILNLDYNDLQPHLRTCLLYLCIFSDNSKIETERLVRRWVAEGFISTACDARSYLSELVNRNLVQPLHMNHEHVPRYCKVHPVMHDFIVCKSKEENFATLVDAQQQYIPNNNSNIRRLSLNSGKQDPPALRNELMDLSHARSITVFGNTSAMPLLTDLKVVRVLDLEGCKGPVCLDGLCKLLLLRYLSLRGTGITALPATIGELKWLQTLDVESTNVKDLPSSILKLEKLTNLLAGRTKLPTKISDMNSLQTLSCSANAMEQIRELANVTGLELFCDNTETPGDEERVTFLGDGFQGVKQLCIRGSSASVAFESGALPGVQVLELRFEKGLADKSSSISGVEHLSSLKHLYVEFFKGDEGAMATVDAMRKAAEGPNHPDVTVMVNGEKIEQ